MKRVLFFSLMLIGLASCGPSCPEEISEEAKSLVTQFQQEVRLREANGLIAPDKYATVGIENAFAFELWVAETRALLAYDQVGALAKRFNYPQAMNLYDGSGKRTTPTPELTNQILRSEEDFCTYYQRFMIEEFKDQMIGNDMVDMMLLEAPRRVSFNNGQFQVSKKDVKGREDYKIVFMYN